MKTNFLNAVRGWSNNVPYGHEIDGFIRREFYEDSQAGNGPFYGYGNDGQELDKYLLIPNALKEVDREYNQKKNDEFFL